MKKKWFGVSFSNRKRKLQNKMQYFLPLCFTLIPCGSICVAVVFFSTFSTSADLKFCALENTYTCDYNNNYFSAASPATFTRHTLHAFDRNPFLHTLRPFNGLTNTTDSCFLFMRIHICFFFLVGLFFLLLPLS